MFCVYNIHFILYDYQNNKKLTNNRERVFYFTPKSRLKKCYTRTNKHTLSIYTKKRVEERTENGLTPL